MARFLAVVPLLFTVTVLAQTSSPTITISDPQALALASKSVLVLTGGNPVSDVSLSGNATWIAGSDRETGPALLYVKGTDESRVELDLSEGTQIQVRAAANGVPAGWWRKEEKSAVAYSQHNCWTDAAWFFPALSSLTRTADTDYVFSDLGQEQRNGLNVEHLRVSRQFQGDLKDVAADISRLSTIDFYLDPASFLPMSISFGSHPDNNANVDIPTEIRFADYQSVEGVKVPFHIQKLINGGLVMDITITKAVLNSGLTDATLNAQ